MPCHSKIRIKLSLRPVRWTGFPGHPGILREHGVPAGPAR